MTKFVSIKSPKLIGSSFGPNEKYVKQTVEMLTNAEVNLEVIAMQITRMSVREQRKFFRLLLNYLDVTVSNSKYTSTPTMSDIIELSTRLMIVVNQFNEEKDNLELQRMESR
jgi:hypothetical protein